MGSVREDSGIQGTAYDAGISGFSNGTSAAGSSGPSITGAGKEQAKKLGGAARSRAFVEIDRQKDVLAKSIDELAKTLEKSQEGAPEMIMSKVTGVLHKTSGILQNRSSEELLESAQSQFRARPGAFLAGFAAVGFIVGRILKE